MKLALLTHYLPTSREDYTQLAAMTVPNRDEYCKRHGYEHIVHAGTYGNPDYYYAVQRLYLLQKLMQERPEIEYWWVLNVQAVITNLTKPVIWSLGCGSSAGAANLYLSSDADFWIAHDCHGLNAGSFIVRNGDWGREWVRFVADQTVARRGSSDPWHEQRTMMSLEQHPFFRDRIEIVPQRVFNSYDYVMYPPWNETTPGHWQPGDLVISLPGMDLQKRLDLVRDVWLPRVQR